MLRYVMLCYVMSCPVLSCPVMSCHVMLCYVMIITPVLQVNTCNYECNVWALVLWSIQIMLEYSSDLIFVYFTSYLMLRFTYRFFNTFYDIFSDMDFKISETNKSRKNHSEKSFHAHFNEQFCSAYSIIIDYVEVYVIKLL